MSRIVSVHTVDDISQTTVDDRTRGNASDALLASTGQETSESKVT